jgi:hypothetical protein
MRRFRLAAPATLIATGLLFAGLQLFSQEPGRNKTVKPKPLAAAHEKQQDHGHLWICAMHPQIRQANSGECPICAMQLVSIDPHLLHEMHAGLPGMQEMLAVALEHSPSVRAAQAKVDLAEAELEQTRLDVVREIIEFRETRRERADKVRATEFELKTLQQMLDDKKGQVTAQQRQMLANANERVGRAKAQLAEFDAQLPLLLGRKGPAKGAHLDDTRRQMIEQTLLPKARQLMKVQMTEYRVGKAQIAALLVSQRRIAALEVELARAPTERAAALNAYRTLLEKLAEIAEQRYRSGNGSQSDVLAVQLEIDALELKQLSDK